MAVNDLKVSESSVRRQSDKLAQVRANLNRGTHWKLMSTIGLAMRVLLSGLGFGSICSALSRAEDHIFSVTSSLKS